MSMESLICTKLRKVRISIQFPFVWIFRKQGSCPNQLVYLTASPQVVDNSDTDTYCNTFHAKALNHPRSIYVVMKFLQWDIMKENINCDNILHLS